MTTEPTNSASALHRATALCELGRWDEAAGQLRTILGTDPHNWEALCLMAQAQLGQDDLEQALDSCFAAISEDSDDDWPYRLASLALSGLGRQQDAMEMARHAVRLAPHAAACHIVFAQASVEASSDFSEARAAADRAVSLAPNDASSHLAVGMVAAADARIDEAVTAYRRALALEPDNWVAHHELARLRPQQSRFDSGGLARAAGGYESALRADPRAQVSRENIDVVLHNFLLQTTWWIVVIALVATRVRMATDSSFARVGPALLLLFPAFFAARFVFVLAPSMRRYLLGRLRSPVLGSVAVCDAIASVGLLVGAASQRAGVIAFGSAAGLGLFATVRLGASARLRSRMDGDAFTSRALAGNTGVLVSRSCTTGWWDWIHGELWLTGNALIRSRLSFRQTQAQGGFQATVSTPTRPVVMPGHLSTGRVAAAHRTNRYFSLADVSWAVLHRGLFSDRLNITLNTGARYKLLWLRADPAYDVLCEALPGVLKNRFVIE